MERHRRISVNIPAGVDNGSQLVMRGEGDAANGDGRRGDLFIVVHLRPHETFQREGNDLVCSVDLPFSKAAVGGELEVPTLDGPARIKVPAGTQSGAMFRLRKKGMPMLRHNSRGDELVVVRVRTPTKLSARQRELMEQLRREGL